MKYIKKYFLYLFLFMTPFVSSAYTITYMDGNEDISNKMFEYDENSYLYWDAEDVHPTTYTDITTNIQISDPHKMYYTFSGWCAETVCDNPTKNYVITTDTKKDITLYAQWNDKPYVVNGKVNPGMAGVKIYEKYNDVPVATTDDRGEFSYTTISAAPVKLIAKKKGFADTVAFGNHDSIISEQNNNAVFDMDEFFIGGDLSVQYVLDSDEECILAFQSQRDAICDDDTNDFKFDCLGSENCLCKGTHFLAPGKDGITRVKNIIYGSTFRPNKITMVGGISFIEKPEGKQLKYELPLQAINRVLELEEPWFELAKNLGGHKQYNSYDEYKPVLCRKILKYCPKQEEYCNQIISGIPSVPSDTDSREKDQSALDEKQKAYDEAKEKEQSKENKTLTALTTAATGIGGMELAMGLSQQAADKDADQSMAAYIETMRCSYADGQQVKAGPDEIELPGGNSSELMSLRSEYFALAEDLKERKNALGMKPGIESEEIIDKTQTGLYDDESLGIDAGAYASLYRAQMLGSEADQAKIDEERKASKNRVIAGATVAGAGVLGGIIGNVLINGTKSKKTDNVSDISLTEQDAHNAIVSDDTEPMMCSLKQCLDSVTIADRTKNEPYYNNIVDFCSSYFGNEPDCIKIMLMATVDNTSAVMDIDTLVANNYDIDYYESQAANFCDSYICDETFKHNELFTEKYYKYQTLSKKNEELRTWVISCMKQAGVRDYLDWSQNFAHYEDINIQMNDINCSDLDQGKSDTDIILKNNVLQDYDSWNGDVLKLLTDEELRTRVFGKYSGFIHVSSDN